MSDPNTALEFLTEEAEAAERGAMLTAVFGIVALVLCGGYMYWVNDSIQQAVRPDVVAEVVTGAAVTSLPEVSEDVRMALKEAAPELAQTVIGATVDGIPALRVRLEATFTEMTDEMAVASAHDVRMRLERHLEAQKGEGTPEDQVEAALASVIDELEVQVRGAPMTGKRTVPATEVGIFTSLHDSVDRLRDIDARLRALAKKKDPDPSERSSRQLITAWLRLIEPEPSTPIEARDGGDEKK